MQKIFIRGVLIVCSFLGLWFVLQNINWMRIFNVEKNTQKTEEKLGKLMFDYFKSIDEEVTNPLITKTVDSLVNAVCEANQINTETLKVHILKNSEINAFALPDRHLVIYTGLIEATDTQEALIGVISHELAHIEKNHVMRKLMKEIGLSVLLSMISGQSNGTVIANTAKVLSSSAFDRSLEKEADIIAIDYMVNTHVNPEPFANFLYFLGGDTHIVTEWISTHPVSEDRSAYILEYINGYERIEYKEIISPILWKDFRDEVYHLNDDFEVDYEDIETDE